MQSIKSSVIWSPQLYKAWGFVASFLNYETFLLEEGKIIRRIWIIQQVHRIAAICANCIGYHLKVEHIAKKSFYWTQVRSLPCLFLKSPNWIFSKTVFQIQISIIFQKLLLKMSLSWGKDNCWFYIWNWRVSCSLPTNWDARHASPWATQVCQQIYFAENKQIGIFQSEQGRPICSM